MTSDDSRLQVEAKATAERVLHLGSANCGNFYKPVVVEEAVSEILAFAQRCREEAEWECTALSGALHTEKARADALAARLVAVEGALMAYRAMHRASGECIIGLLDSRCVQCKRADEAMKSNPEGQA